MKFISVVQVVASLVVFVLLAQAGSVQTSPGAGVPQATLALQTDAPCSLSIAGPDDAIKTRDLPVGSTEISVVPGETTVICSTSEPAVEAFTKTVAATAGQRIAVNIALAAAIAKAHSATLQRCNAEADKGDPDGRFKAAAAGTLIDSQTGLQWTQADNGKPINWKQASGYCSAMKDGWRLPTVDELSVLYSSCVSQSCFAYGGTQFSCHVSSRFHLTGIGYWSNQTQDSSMAFAVDFEGDAPQSGPGISADADQGERVLCVRHP
jgi:hypothetical protein